MEKLSSQIKKPATVFLFVLFLFTAKAFAGENGRIFWKIQKPGIEPSYILGSIHYMPLDENSLPEEITAAINNSKNGVIELTLKEKGKKKTIEAIKAAALFLPKNETLSLYLGEKKAKEVFEFIQFLLNQYDEDGFFIHEMKTVFEINMTSYETINRLMPAFITEILQLLIKMSDIPLEKKQKDLKELSAELNSDFPEQIIFNCSLKTIEEMDVFIEKMFFCNNIPIDSIETAEIQMRASYSKRNHYEEAHAMHLTFKDTIRSIQKDSNEMDMLTIKWELLMREINRRLSKYIANHFHHNADIDISSETYLTLGFLINEQCAHPPTRNRIEEYINIYLQLHQLAFEQVIQETQTEQEFKKFITPLAKNLYTIENHTLSSCFPDYIPDTSNAKVKELTNKYWVYITHYRENLLNTRDIPQVLFLIPYLKKGRVFATIGSAHLNGVLNELKAQGWQIQSVLLSHPIREAQNEDSNAKSKNASDK